MGEMASQIASLAIVYSTIYSGADQRKHQPSASLAFVREIRRWSVNSRHKWPVMREMFPFDFVIMIGNCFVGMQTAAASQLLRMSFRFGSYVIRGVSASYGIYPQTSNISRTKCKSSNVSRLVLQLYLPNPLKPGVENEDVVGAALICAAYIRGVAVLEISDICDGTIT